MGGEVSGLGNNNWVWSTLAIPAGLVINGVSEGVRLAKPFFTWLGDTISLPANNLPSRNPLHSGNRSTAISDSFSNTSLGNLEYPFNETLAQP